MSLIQWASCALALVLSPVLAWSQSATRLIGKNGRHALLVDGSPYLVLGAQIGNSNSWPEVLPDVWATLETIHVNTVEAPVYWEQIEPEPGRFDWTLVDTLLEGARAHHLHWIPLWFGTWKNGNHHYAPEWVKRDTKRFPRMLNSYGTPLDVLSANSPNNLEADRTAFTALCHHLAERDPQRQTVLMIQVENESGAIGTDRDYSPDATRQFEQPVPSELVSVIGRKPGPWSSVFPGNAGEAFQAWSQARYINSIIEAGKREFAVPMYCNVWLAYPPEQLPERRIPIPGIGYPAGGPVQSMLNLWKLAAPKLDAVGPDIYSSNPSFYSQILVTYSRPDNPLWIPETGQGNDYAPFFFAALGHGAIGFSPFGVGPHPGPENFRAHGENYRLFSSMVRIVAQANFDGHVRTAEEILGGAEQEIRPELGGSANATVALADAGTPITRKADAEGEWGIAVHFGFPQSDGRPSPGTAHHSGRVMVAQLSKDEFLLAGIDAAVFFHRPGYLPGMRMDILRAEEGYYTPASQPGQPETWHTVRWLNGDETDRGIRFHSTDAEGQPKVVRIRLSRF